MLLAMSLSASAMLYNVDQPLPLSLAHAEYYVSARLWGSGGVMARAAIGLFDRLTLGVSYGGNRLIGGSTPEFYDREPARPEFQARLAILNELGYVPDLSLGFDSQGFDDCSRGQFAVREKGGYLCIGKTVDVSRTYGFVGFNYWFGANGFIGVNQLLPGGVEVMLEYDPALNDMYEGEELTRGRGFLNCGISWTFNGQVRFGVAVRDLLDNQPGDDSNARMNRVIDIAFRNRF